MFLVITACWILGAPSVHAEKSPAFAWILNSSDDLEEIKDPKILKGLEDARTNGVAIVAVSAPFYEKATSEVQLQVQEIVHGFIGVDKMVVMVYAPLDPSNTAPNVGGAISLLGETTAPNQPCTSWLVGRVIDTVGGDQRLCTIDPSKPPSDDILFSILIREAGKMYFHVFPPPAEKEA